MVGGRKAVAAGLLCLLAASGCTAEAGTPSPTPSATAVATPTETPQERQERLDYAAAEKAYRTFRAEYRRVQRAGGARRATPVMRSTAGGSYLSDFAEVIRGYRKLGTKAVGSERILYVRHGGHAADEVVLLVCEDARLVKIIRADEDTGRGDLRMATLRVRQIGSSWKVWSGEGEVVQSCD